MDRVTEAASEVENKLQLFESDHYEDAVFENVELGEARGMISTGSGRELLDGRFSINVTSSDKFGEEVHFQVYTTRAPELQARNDSKWNRVEIFVEKERKSLAALGFKLLKIAGVSPAKIHDPEPLGGSE